MLPERFWSKVNRFGPVPAHRPELGPCWVWVGGLSEKGYGQIRVGKRMVKANRLALADKLGRPLQGSALHHCDNPACVNNEGHLYEGTHAQNMLDMRTRGRRKGLLAGSENGRAKLTAYSVASIRRALARGVTKAELARKHGVSRIQIARIGSGAQWQNRKGAL